MRIYLQVIVVLIIFLLSITVLQAQESHQKFIQEILNSDGSLRQEASGSFDSKGFNMITDASGKPRFFPQSSEGVWDAQFGLSNGTNGAVYAIVSDGAGNLYIGGSFTFITGFNEEVNYVARYNIGSNTWFALGTGGGNGVSGFVTTIAILGSDVYVGGNFTQANVRGAAIPANYIARWNGSSWFAVGANGGNGVNGIVQTIAVSANEVYIGGSFSSANIGSNEVQANGIVRWNGTSWAALGSSGGNGVNDKVNTIAIAGGNVYVGGEFIQANFGGIPVFADHVALWNGVNWQPVGVGSGTGVDGTVNAIAVSGNDVFVGGEFTEINVGGSPVAASNIALWNGSAWLALGSGAENGTNNIVRSITVFGNDIIVGGEFFQVSSGGETIFAACVARWNGSVWRPLGTSNANGVNNQVYVAVAVGNDIYVGGDFAVANLGGDLAVTSYIGRFNGSSWSGLGVDIAKGVSSGAVNAIAVSGNDVYVGGSFLSVGNMVALGVAKWNGSTWSVLGSGGGNGVIGRVNAIAVSGNDVYVGGEFSQVNFGGTAVNATNIARWNGTSWLALGSGGNGVNGEVNAITVSGNDVYVGGNFTQVAGGTVSANYIARWNGSMWFPLGSGGGNGMNSLVSAITVSGNDVYVGGNFTQVAGGTVSANYIARWNGITWFPLGSGGGNGVSGRVNAIAISGNDIYIGGNFTQANIGGTTIAANRVARWSGSSWSALGSGNGNGVNGFVDAIAISGNDIFVGGLFTQANINGAPVTTTCFAQWNGSAWLPVGSGNGNGTNRSVQAFALLNRDIYMGGGFMQANVGSPISSARFARYIRNPLSIEKYRGEKPRFFALSQNYPNPFNPSTVIGYQLSVLSEVKLEVFDMLGRNVATLVNARQTVGSYQTTFNAASLSSGIYFYKLQAGNFTQTRKMLLVK
jgi:trimeric autotransporter adhesin